MWNWDDFAVDLQAVIADNPISIEIRRAGAIIAAQTVRIARMGGGGTVKQGAGTQESRGRVVILGAIDFDVQPDDRFTVDGELYRVVLVRPNRRAATVAEAEVAQ
jgi:hypothetical protein